MLKNGHLTMETDNILASYNKLDDDNVFTVTDKQILVIWFWYKKNKNKKININFII